MLEWHHKLGTSWSLTSLFWLSCGAWTNVAGSTRSYGKPSTRLTFQRKAPLELYWFASVGIYQQLTTKHFEIRNRSLCTWWNFACRRSSGKAIHLVVASGYLQCWLSPLSFCRTDRIAFRELQTSWKHDWSLRVDLSSFQTTSNNGVYHQAAS